LVLYAIKPFEFRPSVIKTIFLLPGHPAILPVSWSLSYELYFYAAFGLSTYLKGKRLKNTFFLSAFMISIIVTLTGVFSDAFKGSAINFLAGHNFWEFLLGILCGHLFLKRPLPRLVSVPLFLVSFYCFATINIPFGAPVAALIYGPGAFGTLYAITCLEKHRFPRRKIVNVLGQSSYAIYLLAPVYLLIVVPKDATQILLSILVITLFGILINRAFEEPMLKWLRQRFFHDDYSRKADPASFP
jgi:peptidoglycan/LPS O-acetylase OafA/YrhL